MENRLEKLEALLAQVRGCFISTLIACSRSVQVAPGTDFSQELGERFDKRTWMKINASIASTHPDVKASSPPPISLASPRVLREDSLREGSEDSNLDPSDDEQPREIGGTLTERLERLELNPGAPRFLGKSSGVELVQSALALKNEFSGMDANFGDIGFPGWARRPQFWQVTPARILVP